MPCSSSSLTISLFERFPWLYNYKTEKKTLPIPLDGFSMIVSVTRMIIMTIFITNVYSTGYGIGTVFPFA